MSTSNSQYKYILVNEKRKEISYFIKRNEKDLLFLVKVSYCS